MRAHDQPVIDLHFAPTPDGWKVTIMLEECGLPYQLLEPDAHAVPDPEFANFRPDGREPAIVDHDTGLHVFGSGAILQYLAEKTGRFLPIDPDGKYAVLPWLFWQVGRQSPVAAELAHYAGEAPGGPTAHDYAYQRCKAAYDELYGVMEQALSRTAYLAGDYSIADMAAFPWVVPYKRLQQDMRPYPGVRRWFDTLKHRTGVRRGMDVGLSL